MYLRGVRTDLLPPIKGGVGGSNWEEWLRGLGRWDVAAGARCLTGNRNEFAVEMALNASLAACPVIVDDGVALFRSVQTGEACGFPMEQAHLDFAFPTMGTRHGNSFENRRAGRLLVGARGGRHCRI